MCIDWRKIQPNNISEYQKYHLIDVNNERLRIKYYIENNTNFIKISHIYEENIIFLKYLKYKIEVIKGEDKNEIDPRTGMCEKLCINKITCVDTIIRETENYYIISW